MAGSGDEIPSAPSIERSFSMKIRNAYAENQPLDRAIETITAALAGFEPALLLFFASPLFEGAAVSAAMADAFPRATVFGCSSAGELTSGRMLKNSLSALAFSREAMGDACISVVDNMNNGMDVDSAFSVFEEHYGVSSHDLDPARHVGIVLVDGLCRREEVLMDRIGDLTMVNFIGGSAGDDLQFRQTQVYANGRAYTNAAVLALVRPLIPFTFVKTQSFVPLEKKLLVTAANEEAREVISFNGKPAAQAYAEALDVTLEEASRRLKHNPLGLIIDGVPFVRSPQRIQGSSMFFYCGIREGMELSLLEATDIIADTRAALDEVRRKIGPLSGLISFNCIMRIQELEQNGLTDQYGALFSDVPTAGLGTYGEQFIGHINQTATMLVFG
jgi:hypothetical protein